MVVIPNHLKTTNNNPYHTLVTDKDTQEALMFNNYMQAHQAINAQVNAQRIADYIANEAAARALKELEKALKKNGFK